MKKQILSKKSFGLIASLLGVLSLLAVAATPVFAKPLSPLNVAMFKLPVANKTVTDDKLSQLFAHETMLFDSLHPGADIRMTAVKEAIEAFNDTEKVDSGVSIEMREKAVSAVAGTVTADDLRISGLVKLARDLIAAHPGFDKDGAVTNATVALQTINTLNDYTANIRYFINRTNSELARADMGRLSGANLKAIVK